MGSIKLINIGQLVTFDSILNKMIRLENPEIIIEEGKIYDIVYKLGPSDKLFDCSR